MRISIALLSYDHGVIRMVIDVLLEITEKDALGRFRGEASEISKFLKGYINDFHHEKEERFLFPAVLRLDPAMDSDIRELVQDHAHAREVLKELGNSSEINEGSKFKVLSKEIVEIMTAHIDKEEKDVFPRIELLLTPSEDRAIYSATQVFADGVFGPGYVRSSEKFAAKVQEKVLGADYYKKLA